MGDGVGVTKEGGGELIAVHLLPNKALEKMVSCQSHFVEQRRGVKTQRSSPETKWRKQLGEHGWHLQDNARCHVKAKASTQQHALRIGIWPGQHTACYVLQ